MSTIRILFSFVLIGIFFGIEGSYAGVSEEGPTGICGEGLILQDGKCIIVEQGGPAESLPAIYIPIIITAIGSAIGFFFTGLEVKRGREEKNLSLVGDFSGQLNTLKDKERILKSKKDCEIYAQNYVDLMDQIAFLFDAGSIPKKIAAYFENEFSYALTMIEWMNENAIEEKLFINPYKKVNRDVETLTVEKKILNELKKKKRKIDYKTISIYLEAPQKFSVDDQYPWTDLLSWCVKERISPFPATQLPIQMQEYTIMPEEERERIMETINEYSRQITELKNQEDELKTKKDCQTYAQNYVDLMDQIAFLHLKKTFPSDIDEYFENEFEYALTMIRWLEESRVWCELRNFIEKNVSEEKKKKIVNDIQRKEKVNQLKKANYEEETIEWDYLKQQFIDLDKKINEYIELVEARKQKSEEEQKNDSGPEDLKKQFKEDHGGKLALRGYTWTSLMRWCNNQELIPFDRKQLPETMLDYEKLPDTEMDTILELIKSYGEKLADLTSDEKNLKRDNYLACELYANSYIDKVDGIAFLYHTKAIPEQVAEYLENNFCYALTLYRWLVKHDLSGLIPIVEKEGNKPIAELTLEEFLSEEKYKDPKFKVDQKFTWTDLMTRVKIKEYTPFEDTELPLEMIKVKVPEEVKLHYKK